MSIKKSVNKITLKLLNNSDIRDYEDILICAIRYSLGRRTYMPSEVTNFIMRHKEEIISNRIIDIILRDIEEQATFGYGDSCDKETWMNFKAFLIKCKEEIESKNV